MTRPKSARGALNPFGTLAERLALIDDTVWYCHIAAETAGGDAILLSTWPDRRCIVLSQARLLPRFPAFRIASSSTSVVWILLQLPIHLDILLLAAFCWSCCCVRPCVLDLRVLPSSDKSHAAGHKAVGIRSMATLDAAPQFGAELKVLFVRDNYCWSMLTSW